MGAGGRASRSRGSGDKPLVPINPLCWDVPVSATAQRTVSKSVDETFELIQSMSYLNEIAIPTMPSYSNGAANFELLFTSLSGAKALESPAANGDPSGVGAVYSLTDATSMFTTEHQGKLFYAVTCNEANRKFALQQYSDKEFAACYNQPKYGRADITFEVAPQGHQTCITITMNGVCPAAQKHTHWLCVALPCFLPHVVFLGAMVGLCSPCCYAGTTSMMTTQLDTRCNSLLDNLKAKLEGHAAPASTVQGMFGQMQAAAMQNMAGMNPSLAAAMNANASVLQSVAPLGVQMTEMQQASTVQGMFGQMQAAAMQNMAGMNPSLAAAMNANASVLQSEAPLGVQMTEVQQFAGGGKKRFCTKCGTKATADDAFCGNCGHKL